jgi:hypothetical protein
VARNEQFACGGASPKSSTLPGHSTSQVLVEAFEAVTSCIQGKQPSSHRLGLRLSLIFRPAAPSSLLQYNSCVARCDRSCRHAHNLQTLLSSAFHLLLTCVATSVTNLAGAVDNNEVEEWTETQAGLGFRTPKQSTGRHQRLYDTTCCTAPPPEPDSSSPTIYAMPQTPFPMPLVASTFCSRKNRPQIPVYLVTAAIHAATRICCRSSSMSSDPLRLHNATASPYCITSKPVVVRASRHACSSLAAHGVPDTVIGSSAICKYSVSVNRVAKESLGELNDMRLMHMRTDLQIQPSCTHPLSRQEKLTLQMWKQEWYDAHSRHGSNPSMTDQRLFPSDSIQLASVIAEFSDEACRSLALPPPQELGRHQTAGRCATTVELECALIPTGNLNVELLIVGADTSR